MENGGLNQVTFHFAHWLVILPGNYLSLYLFTVQRNADLYAGHDRAVYPVFTFCIFNGIIKDMINIAYGQD